MREGGRGEGEERERQQTMNEGAEDMRGEKREGEGGKERMKERDRRERE